MASVKHVAAAIAAILVREGVDYAQSKAVFKAARERAGLRAPPEHRGGVDRLTVEEELRFLDRAYAQDGRTGLMLQTLLETGARASELVQLRVEDVSLVERVITIRQGKGGKRREVPIRRDLAQLLRLHIGARRAGPLFASRQGGSGPTRARISHCEKASQESVGTVGFFQFAADGQFGRFGVKPVDRYVFENGEVLWTVVTAVAGAVLVHVDVEHPEPAAPRTTTH